MKKNVLLIIGTIVVLVALAIALVFVLGNKEEAPAPKLPDLTGNWTVVGVYTDDKPVFTDKQYMVFTDTTATVYQGQTDTAYATSTYSINEASQLILPDISREYKVDCKTARCVRLYESATQYMLLVKNSDDALPPRACTAQDLEGKWNVAMKGDQFNNGEVLEFSDGTLRYYKAGAAEPFATASFSVENGTIIAQSLGMEMKCYRTAANALALVEKNGIVWELVK